MSSNIAHLQALPLVFSITVNHIWSTTISAWCTWRSYVTTVLTPFYLIHNESDSTHLKTQFDIFNLPTPSNRSGAEHPTNWTFSNATEGVLPKYSVYFRAGMTVLTEE